MTNTKINKNNSVIQELRWDPLLEEWIMVSNLREQRPWRPSRGCPFCPGSPETGYGWEILVLNNKFPMLSENPPTPTKDPFYRTAPAKGRCLVLVETPEHNIDDLSDLSLDNIYNVFKKIKDLTKEFKKVRWAIYLFYFRNKGEEIGVSLTHPHSQIYVTPFVPSKVLRELNSSRKYFRSNKECLFCRIIKEEERSSTRVLLKTSLWIAFIPFFAHWPFEIHIYPLRHVQTFDELENDEIKDLSKILKLVLCSLKKTFERPMPYMLVLHQAPLKGSFSYYHLHFEIYGVYRVSGKLKYAAGMETGGGNFTYDSTPENATKILKRTLENYCLKLSDFY